MSLPRMSLHIGDYLKDTAHLDAPLHGAYLLLIMHYWANGRLPDDDRQLCQIVRMTPAAWRRTRPVVQAFFHDGWKHKRIDKEMADAQEKYERRANAGKKSAETKWGAGRPEATRSQRLAAARAVASHSQEVWEAMVFVFGCCVKCGTKNSDLNGGRPCKDHIVPIYQGGNDGIENIQPMCRPCNTSKGQDTTDYRESRLRGWRERLTKCLTDASQPITDNRDSKTKGRVLESSETNVSAPDDPERDLFRRGKSILGQDSGGLIQKLLKAKKSIPAARAAIETASTKQDPREFVAACIRGDPAAQDARARGDAW